MSVCDLLKNQQSKIAMAKQFDENSYDSLNGGLLKILLSLTAVTCKSMIAEYNYFHYL